MCWRTARAGTAEPKIRRLRSDSEDSPGRASVADLRLQPEDLRWSRRWGKLRWSKRGSSSAGSPAANLESAHRHNGPSRFTFVAGDVRHPELSDIVAGCNPDVVFHLAAQIDVRRSVEDPLNDARNNVLGTINLLEASRRAQVPRIVYAASGGSRYGA